MIQELGCDIHLYHLSINSIKMTINWDSFDVVSGSCIAGEFCFFDKHGRALHVNVNENRVTSFSI
ncbi:hypothetical protein [Gilliamella sp. wkB108]|uniref:hypothetical protein n=1 Tax=Gilliamella sp. wkB108 TaxID=3120256 RepID=UPI0011473559|nr:hypothetical protein [Gilliamella apicola]